MIEWDHSCYSPAGC